MSEWACPCQFCNGSFYMPPEYEDKDPYPSNAASREDVREWLARKSGYSFAPIDSLFEGEPDE